MCESLRNKSKLKELDIHISCNKLGKYEKDLKSYLLENVDDLEGL